MRISALLVAGLLFVVLLAAGCGGDDELAPQVPGPPAAVTVPDAGVSPSGDAAEEDSSSTDDSADPDATETPTAEPEGTGDTGAAEPDASGGTAAPAEPQADGPTNDTAPPEGSNAQQFEDFCAQNPGAC